MLSKLINSARNIFTCIPQTNTATKEELTTERNTEMVTTRAQRGNSAFENADSIVVDIPRSARKHPRAASDEDLLVSSDEEEAVKVPAKKQKTLTLKEEDDEIPNKSTRVVVEIPVRSIPVETHNLVEDIEQGMEEEEGSDDEQKENGQDSDDEGEREAAKVVRIEISDSESDEGSEGPEGFTIPSPGLLQKEKTLAHYSKTNEATGQPEHKRFGSEEPALEAEFVSTSVEVIESDQESSDDDAPEVVGARDAFRRAQSKARDATKAVEEQDTASRKKRQERDSQLKKQAEAAKKKRKHAEHAEEKIRKLEDPKLDQEDGIKIDGIEDVASMGMAIAPVVINKSSLPDLLPDEYLEDDEGNETHAELDLDVVRTKPKKLKFTDLVQKKPKDRRKGSTTYRVSEVRNKHLAPKSSFHAKTTKEAWLKGRAPVGAGGARRSVSSGFFKK